MAKPKFYRMKTDEERAAKAQLEAQRQVVEVPAGETWQDFFTTMKVQAQEMRNNPEHKKALDALAARRRERGLK